MGIFHDSSTAYHCVHGHQGAAQNIYARSPGTLQPDNATIMWPRLHIWPQLRDMFVLLGMLGSVLRISDNRADPGPE